MHPWNSLGICDDFGIAFQTWVTSHVAAQQNHRVIPSSTTLEAQIAEAIKACSSLEEATHLSSEVSRKHREVLAREDNNYILSLSDETVYQHALEMTKIFSERCSLCSKMSLRRRRQFVFPNYLLMSQ